MENVESRFLRYVRIDTQSDPKSNSVPSTVSQTIFLKMLMEEMREIGIKDIFMDANSYVIGTIPANTDKKVPVIGFIAHADTSPDLRGDKVNPQLHLYKGGDLMLNQHTVMSVSEFPELNRYIGHTLITTDGTTLLGADDKAGIAEILTAAEIIIQSSWEHGEIKIGFTPDEEIGRGANYFDVAKFGADFAYTVDGGSEGELEYENFNAASIVIHINGSNIHPGYAKGKMKNALRICMELDGYLPEIQRPETTAGYEGFFHLTDINGTVESAAMEYLIRDHNKTEFESKKTFIKAIAQKLNSKYGTGTVEFTITDQYFNMREVIERNKGIIDLALQAMENCGVVPIIKPIRGGTDGVRLSFMGLPCPNLFVGGENFHGRYEFVSVQVMQKAVDVIVEIAKLNVLDY